jgi:phosphatidylglycerophosphate synthase
VYLTSNSIWAPIFLVFSLICDGVDGSLALISNKSSKMGAVLDSIVDRFTEIFWVLALYQLGVDIYLLLFVCTIAFTQEYLRARAMGVGLTEITIVTFAERPVRASFIFIALIAFQFEFQILNMVVMIWSVLQLISFLMIVRFIYSKIG